MKTRYFATFILAFFLFTSPLLHAIRARRSTSYYGADNQYTSQTFGHPPVQYPNETEISSKTVEVCAYAENPCVSSQAPSHALSHAFIYKFQLPAGDPGTVTSLTLTVNAAPGDKFSKSPTWGVMTCDAGGSPAPCSNPNAPLTACAESANVNESGIRTPTYSQTWTFAGCSQPFVAGQSLAIFIDLCTVEDGCDDSQDNPSPVIDYEDGAGVLVSVGVSRPAQFVPVTPCRLVDTRLDGGPIWEKTSRDFIVPNLGDCKIPAEATAYSLNVTVVPHGYLEFLTVFPTGKGQPAVSTLNSHDGRVKANAAIVPAGDQDSVSVFAYNTADVVLDIDGYFVPTALAPPSVSTLQFYTLPPCRVADTRNATGLLGGPSIAAGGSRAFPILSSSCGIPSTAQAYSLNVTAVPHKTLNYLTTWPTGESQPNASTLNAPTGAITANAAIVPAGINGQVSIFASDTSDVILDVNGYFAPRETGGLSLYSIYPCRVLDTRPPSGNGPFSRTLTVGILNSACAPSSQAQSYVFNATVVPPGPMSYLTLWSDDGSNPPTVSTLNANDGEVTSNLAIVPAGNQGKIDVFASAPTNMLLDIAGYFAP